MDQAATDKALHLGDKHNLRIIDYLRYWWEIDEIDETDEREKIPGIIYLGLILKVGPTKGFSELLLLVYYINTDDKWKIGST